MTRVVLLTTQPGRLGRRAFTLIELLVVIAIISLLVSILIPSLQKAKELAKLTICATQLRGLGIAANVSASENEGEYPHTDSKWNGGYYRSDISSPEVVCKDTFCEPLRDIYGCPREMFYCPLKGYEGPWPDWGEGDNREEDWKPVLWDTNKRRVELGYTYLGWIVEEGKDDNGNLYGYGDVFPGDEYDSPMTVETAEPRWVLMSDQCRMWYDSAGQTNHFFGAGDVSNNILRVDQSVELRKSDQPDFDLRFSSAGGAGRDWW